ncbi:hypothetical protein RJ640_018850 [Escallonia rubra]|uniref:MBD domain-containing protein n=1 Tax=Escallonia rubra TaxID=112253 RepID=A0AA88RTH4_9ASTE|nr:hypothetical protein RJ640_018850 [Escallonia rubra]
MVARNSPDWLPSGWTKVKNGRKVQCYCNVETGQKFYSKEDVIRYVEMRNSRGTPQPGAQPTSDQDDVISHVERSNGPSTPQPTPKLSSERRATRSNNEPLPIEVKTNENPEWLPHGWIMELKTQSTGRKYKCYINTESGCKLFSKPAVLRYLQAVNSSISKQNNAGISSGGNTSVDRVTEDKSTTNPDVCQNVDRVTVDQSFSKPDVRQNRQSALRQKKSGICKRALMDNAVISRGPAEGLPPGWILEMRTRRYSNRKQRDPFYMDPVSGYIFRSKLDVLRYLETGDINKCAIKPKKKDANDLEVMEDEISAPSAVDGKIPSHNVAKRQLFAGEESLAAREAESSEARQDNNALKHSVNAINSEESSDLKTEINNEKGSVSIPAIDVLHEKLPENVEQIDEISRIDSTKSKKKRALSVPGRSSKRIAGLKPEVVANYDSSERVLRSAARKASVTEANPPLNPAVGAAELEAQPESEPLNKIGKPAEDQAEPEGQSGSQTAEKQNDEKNESQESPLLFPFMDSVADPCLEFAVKTLTGAIPIADDTKMPGCFQQQDNTPNTQPVSGLHRQFDPPEKPVPIQQLLQNTAHLNIGVPLCGSIGPQESSLRSVTRNVKQS